MSAPAKVRHWQRQAQIRVTLSHCLVGLPLLCGTVLLAQRFLPYHVAWALLILGTLTLVLTVLDALSKLDQRWLIRQLDQRRPELENSADLLFAEPAKLGVLQLLQRQRVEHKIAAVGAGFQLRRPWPWKAVLVSATVAALMIGAARYWPRKPAEQHVLAMQEQAEGTQASSPVRLLQAAIRVSPPAYTGLPDRSENGLAVTFPEGSVLQWRLAFQPQPENVSVVFFDGSRLPLQRKGDVWLAARALWQSNLYRIEVDGQRLAGGKRFRLDVVKDQAPQIKVMQPDRSLSLVELGQESWPLSFEASDDHGLAGAQLRIQLAQGTGENISFKEQTIALTGQGSAVRRRYAHRIDLNTLGLAPGDDLIVQFAVSDRRAPKANTTRSASFILRWPPDSGVEASGVEGMLKKVVPAYFRSQRQIIIDTEKLIAERRKLDKDGFELRSDNIGVDQRLLRLRYGQFLGEETETERRPPATQDDSGKDEIHSADDGHGHDDEPPKAKGDAGGSQAILEEFGHTHDIAEAATLLDDETKKLLRAALNEMWQAELHLRQSNPKLALPYEYRALEFIKKVQQADRIYLARVGNEQPPIDEGRRLSGDRTGLSAREDWLSAASQDDAALMDFWRALDVFGPDADAAAPDYAALQAWISANPARIGDSLSLLAALDDYQSQPGCGPCLLALKAQLWPLLPKPAAAPPRRPAGSRMGQQYLEALRKERRP